MIESGSSIARFMECPKKYQFAYEKMLEGHNYSTALGYGNFVHACIEVMSGKGRDDVLDRLLFEQIERYSDLRDQAQIRADYDMSKRVTRLWYEFWGKEHPFGNTQLEWKKAELEWKYQLEGTSFFHVGKSDGVVLHKKYNRLFLYELKTAADRSRESYVHRLQVDKQISSNIIALRSMGIQVEGVIYDVIWKPQLKMLKDRKTKPDETVQEFQARTIIAMEDPANCSFERYVVYRTDQDLADYSIDLRQQFEAINRARGYNAWYRNSGACDNFGKLCPYFSVCVEGKAELEQLFHRRQHKLPELSKEVQDDTKNN